MIPDASVIRLTKEESHHLLAVLRARSKDKVVVFNGKGQQWNGLLSSGEGKIAIIEVLNTYKLLEPKPRLILAQCMTKLTTFETIIRKLQNWVSLVLFLSLACIQILKQSLINGLRK